MLLRRMGWCRCLTERRARPTIPTTTPTHRLTLTSINPTLLLGPALALPTRVDEPNHWTDELEEEILDVQHLALLLALQLRHISTLRRLATILALLGFTPREATTLAIPMEQHTEPSLLTTLQELTTPAPILTLSPTLKRCNLPPSLTLNPTLALVHQRRRQPAPKQATTRLAPRLPLPSRRPQLFHSTAPIPTTLNHTRTRLTTSTNLTPIRPSAPLLA